MRRDDDGFSTRHMGSGVVYRGCKYTGMQPTYLASHCGGLERATGIKNTERSPETWRTVWTRKRRWGWGWDGDGTRGREEMRFSKRRLRWATGLANGPRGKQASRHPANQSPPVAPDRRPPTARARNSRASQTIPWSRKTVLLS